MAVATTVLITVTITVTVIVTPTVTMKATTVRSAAVGARVMDGTVARDPGFELGNLLLDHSDRALLTFSDLALLTFSDLASSCCFFDLSQPAQEEGAGVALSAEARPAKNLRKLTKSLFRVPMTTLNTGSRLSPASSLL